MGQAILPYMLFEEALPHRLLPAIYNWQCHLAMPLWDQDQKRFVEPCEPHAPIQVMHRTDRTKAGSQPIRIRNGAATVETSLSFAAYRRLRAAALTTP